MLNIISHEANANENHWEIAPHTHEEGYNERDRK